MESSKKGGMLGGAEKLVAKFSEEQKRIFSNLSSVPSSKSVSSSSCSGNQSKVVKPPGSLDDSVMSSDDDCIIIDISDDDEKEVMLEDVSSEISNESKKDETGSATELKAETDDDSESEKDWEVITIDDDEDKPKIPPERMICYRCPNKKLGAFKDVKKYFAHIKRHVLSDHFACPICKRPFIKLNYCLSHELRVHGSSLEFDFKDPVISMAKNYVSTRKAKSSKAGPSTRRMETDEQEMDVDCEHVRFYENRFFKSTSVYPYRGPIVTSVLEAYEIQNFQPRKKANRINGVAKIAINVHKQNVEKEQDTFKLGKFSGRKGQRGKIAEHPNAVKPVPKKKPLKPSKTLPKRPRETASESEINAKEQPKKKRVRYAYITSSSSSSESDGDDTTDADYAPSKRKRYEESGSVSSSSHQPPGKITYKKALPPILNRKCVKCKNFEWSFPDDLRSHRDAMHPNVPLVDLMAVLCPVAQSRKANQNKHGKKVDLKVTEKKEVSTKAAVKTNEKVVPVPSKKAEKKVPEPAKKDSKAKKTVQEKKSEKKTADVSAKKTRVQRKGRSKGDRVPRSQFPLPDSTFSQKELFLHALGLSNSIRLHLHEKKPVEDLNLPPCSVMVQKLSDLELALYSDQRSMSSLHSLLQGHFLAS